MTDEPRSKRQVIYTTRACLKCNEDFESAGSYNRICERCNRQNIKVDNLRIVSDKHQPRKGIGSD